MTENDLMVGLCVGEEGIQAVEIDRSGASPTLRAIDEWSNTICRAESIPTQADVDQFREYLSTFLKINRSRARRVSVALDTTYLFLNTVPMEEGISKEERTDQTQWELAQYFPQASVGDFVTAYHRIEREPPGITPEYLCVSVRRKDAHALQLALETLGLSLEILDVDHFSGDTALRVNYPDSSRRSLVLVGVKRHRLDVSWTRHGSLESYEYRLVGSPEEIIDEFARLARRATGTHSFVAFGPFLDKDLLAQIRRASPVLIEALNPLRHVNVADTLRISGTIHAPSYRFTAAVGVALRKD